jgi:hypothetical protein
MDFIGNKICFFCEHGIPDAWMMNKYDEIWVCIDCDEMYLHLTCNSQEIKECPVCYENKKLAGLPTCNHAICVQCCKTIYFGTTTVQRPKSSNEVAEELLPNWPYECNNDNNNDQERYDEYTIFEETNFIPYNEEKTYDELIIIRNNLINERPEWMNTEEFINYENALFRYYKECQKADKDWEVYNETKTKGNSKCPLCRKSTAYSYN